MGKGFQNFMSKKDFHPSAWWNLKKVWEAKEKKKMDEQKQEELKIQYEKEQEMMNNKALLGDEKAKLGLSFMYDAPTGMTKREEPKEEPKFEWQRKYNAPREEWAKGNDAIQDQPFGIQVRNVRCVKCHTWGHLNTDRECPLFNMSGNADNPGIVTNPSDVLREMREKKVVKEENVKKDDPSDDEPDYEAEPKAKPIPQIQLLSDMKEDHGFKFKKNILQNLRSEEVLTNLGTKKPTEGNLEDFLGHLNDKQRKNIVAKVFGKKSKEYLAEKSKQKSSKSAKKETKKSKASEDEKSTRRSRRDDRHPKQKRHSDETERKKKRKRRSSSESSDDSGIERKRRRHDRVGDEICRQKARSRREDSSSEDERRHRSHGSKQNRRSRSPNYRKHR